MNNPKRFRSRSHTYHSAVITRLLKRGTDPEDEYIVSLATERAYITLLASGVESGDPTQSRAAVSDRDYPPALHFMEEVAELFIDLNAYKSTLPEPLRQRYRTDTDRVMAEFYGCPIAHWQAWIAFVESGALCTGSTRQGSACTRIVSNVPSPQEFVPGHSDRCHQHKPR